MSLEVGMVGAGAGTAAATYTLCTSRPDVEVTVFEKSRGLCGRAAARRRDGMVYEYGANYLKDAGGRASALVTDAFDTGLVEVEGPIWTFDADGTVSKGRGGDARRWTYEDGITRLAKHLFDATGATIRRGTRIEALHDDDGWHLTTTDGSTHGPFDALLLNPPAPQTAGLLDETGIDAVDRLGEAAGAVEYRTVWTAVLGYDFEIDVPYYALVNTDKNHEVGWIGREECKPGHVPEGKSVLVVQASPEWSTQRYDAPPEDNIADLARHAAALIGDERLTAPDWTDHQGWRYALPDDGLRNGPRREAAREGVHVTGDWVAGAARLHAAIRSGLETGEQMASTLADG